MNHFNLEVLLPLDLPELVDRYQNAMNMVYQAINQIMKEKIHSDLTTEQFPTLQYIRDHKQCTSTDIAGKFGIGKSAVTAQINRLHEKGLIKRIRDNKDRRNIYLYVTAKGEELITYTEKELYGEISKHLANFNQEDIQTFIELLERLANIMSEEGKRP